MSDLVYDEEGFTCECGTRNDYPGYVKEHWGVRLSFACACRRKYVIFHGTVTKSPPESPEVIDSEAFGD